MKCSCGKWIYLGISLLAITKMSTLNKGYLDFFFLRIPPTSMRAQLAQQMDIRKQVGLQWENERTGNIIRVQNKIEYDF